MSAKSKKMDRKYIDMLTNWLVGFGIEPYLHIILTQFVCILTLAVLTIVHVSGIPLYFIPAAMGILVGILKEVIDKGTGGPFSMGDLLSDVVGVAIFESIVLILKVS